MRVSLQLQYDVEKGKKEAYVMYRYSTIKILGRGTGPSSYKGQVVYSHPENPIKIGDIVNRQYDSASIQDIQEIVL